MIWCLICLTREYVDIPWEHHACSQSCIMMNIRVDVHITTHRTVSMGKSFKDPYVTSKVRSSLFHCRLMQDSYSHMMKLGFCEKL